LSNGAEAVFRLPLAIYHVRLGTDKVIPFSFPIRWTRLIVVWRLFPVLIELQRLLRYDHVAVNPEFWRL